MKPKTRNRDLSGKKFGRLTVIGLAGSDGKRRRWRCLCSCGKESTPLTEALTSGHTTSCGCYGAEQRRRSTVKYNGKSVSHRAEYKAWFSMTRRCSDRSDAGYHNYGGRGIRVCSRWLGTSGFENFISDMGPKPSPKHSIDRVDNNKGYNPTNCRWADQKTQSNNKRTNRFLEWGGERLTISQWANKLGIRKGTIRARIIKGWSVEKTLSSPLRG